MTKPTKPTKLTELTGRERLLAGLAFVTLCFVWGTTFLAIKVAVETLPALLMTGARFTLAGAGLLLVCLLSRQKFPSGRGDWLHLALVGVLMIGVGNVAVVWALKFLNSGTTALLIATGPFWMGAVEAFRRDGRKFSRTQFVGLLIAFLGVAVLSAPELGRAELGRRFLLGALSVQLACVAWAVGSVRSKYWPTVASPLTSAAVQMLAGGLAVGVAALLNGEASRFTLTPRTLAAFSYLTVFGSVAAYTSYVYALSKLSTATVALSDYIIPGIAVVLGWLVLSEPLGWRTLAALALILAGVAFDQAARRMRSWRELRGGRGVSEDDRADCEISVR